MERTIASKIEKSCSSPMLFWHSMSMARQLMPIDNTAVHKNKINVALYLMWLTVGYYETSNRPQGRNNEDNIIWKYRLRIVEKFKMRYCLQSLHCLPHHHLPVFFLLYQFTSVWNIHGNLDDAQNIPTSCTCYRL